jgi:hypothetical protein
MDDSKIDTQVGRVIITNPPVTVSLVDAPAPENNSSIDAFSLIKEQLEADEQIVWHGHPSAGAAKIRLIAALILILCMGYFAWLAFSTAIPIGQKWPFSWDNFVIFSLIGLSQIIVAGLGFVGTWQGLLTQTVTVYAVSDKRAFKVSPAGLLWKRNRVPTKWELRTFTPPDVTKESERTIQHLQNASHDFLLEFEQIPGGREQIRRLRF